MENGIQYLRELALAEIMHGVNLDDDPNSQDPDADATSVAESCKECTIAVCQRPDRKELER